MRIGTKVRLTAEAKHDTYYDMDWKDDDMIITHAYEDGEGLGDIYSFNSLTSDKRIICSMYSYELEKI